jgi:hypothetical protein
VDTVLAIILAPLALLLVLGGVVWLDVGPVGRRGRALREKRAPRWPRTWRGWFGGEDRHD